ncbi:Gfo/Idh/MocA family oxidoreductase [Robiginitalea sp. M366]|uniref:Gfo/Idh/MocA family protein n=1 Tax=Robiginitalea aestuariiviva TaxID=3036903 RepID=UPI00240DFDF3|nr:Gfo/Idh/MocA family oxidoreductase [Robiginitalea aestuariiviva]MDG1571123.1 Gfo/Idh/MocA family oxidoreductase [Robiginitalea aestuariiviva]
MKPEQNPRRNFLKKAGLATAGLATGPYLMAAHGQTRPLTRLAGQAPMANDHIQLGLIGCGIQGIYDTRSALEVPGVTLTAVCDLYTGRLERATELWGEGLFLTQDYRELLARPDIDAVIVATPDHWHKRIVIDALEAGKAVYCEKPMVQQAAEGHEIIAAERKTGGILQVGSQGMSSLGNEKARELYQAGAIGEIVMLDMYNDRYSAEGAWQYPIPPDANPDTVDFDTFLGRAPKRPYDNTRFFRWRNYRDYGTGVAGDLFVHAFSTLHYILDSQGPVRALSTGGLRYWNDGRDVPDVTLTFYDFPKTDTHAAFNASFRVNFIAGGGGGGGFRMVGTEGAMEVGQRSVKLSRTALGMAPGGYSMVAQTEANQQALREQFAKQFPPNRAEQLELGETVWEAPRDYQGGHYDHFHNFFEAVRGNKKVVQDATFGLRAAGAALLANESYFKGQPVAWDPVKMRLV